MIASVSMAATDSFRGRITICACAIVSANSRRVMTWNPSASSTTSTPCPALLYTSLSSARAARQSSALASGSSTASSDSASGRAAENNAASSSLVSCCTGNLQGAEGSELRQSELAHSGQLENGDQGRNDVGDRWFDTQCRAELEPLTRFQERTDPARGALDIQRPRHHAVNDRPGHRVDDVVGRLEQVVDVEHQGRRRKVRRVRQETPREMVRPPLGLLTQPARDLAHLFVLQQAPDQLGARV